MNEPEARAESVEPKSPVWAQVLAIAVIVTIACAWLLSERKQELDTDVQPSSAKKRAAAEDDDPEDEMAEADKPAAPTRAPAREPEGERAEPSPE